MNPGPAPRLVTENNLRAYFHDAIQQAVAHQNIDTDDATIWYLTHLLEAFSRSERLFAQTEDGVTLPPLVAFYSMAADAASERERCQWLRQLGDVALFVSGFFSGLFTRRRRLVDIDYYITMGGGAYAYLGERPSGTSMGEIFTDLSRQFVRFVDVLAEIGERAFGADGDDLARAHDLWLKTDSPRQAGRLIAAGITPFRGRPS